MVWRLSYDLLSLENSSCFHMTDTFSYDFIWLLLILKQEESSCFLYDFSSHKLFKGKQSWIIFSETNPKWNKPWSNINTNYSTYPNLFICIAQFLQNLCRRRQRSLFGPPHQYLRYVRLVWIISVWRLCTRGSIFGPKSYEVIWFDGFLMTCYLWKILLVIVHRITTLPRK